MKRLSLLLGLTTAWTLLGAGPAAADPISIAILGAIGITATSTAVAATTALLTFAASTALSFASALLFKPTAGRVGGITTEITTGGAEPRQIPLGRHILAGQYVYSHSYGGGRRPFLQLVYLLSDWECESLEAVWVDGKRRTLTAQAIPGGNTENARYHVEDFGSKIVVRWFKGAAGQAADAELVANAGSANRWASTDILAGQAYVSLTLEYDKKLFQQGLPEFRFEIKGAKLYDWRKDTTAGGAGTHRWNDITTWEFSENPAVEMYNVLRGFWRGGEVLAGAGVPAADLIQDMFTAAASLSDEVVNEGGEDVARYRCAHFLSDGDRYRDSVEAIAASMAGYVYERNGLVGPIGGGSQAVVASLAETDLAVGAPQVFSRFAESDTVINYVTGRYTDRGTGGELEGYKPVTDAAWETADGERLARTLDLPMVQSPHQAQRVARIRAKESRLQATASIVVGQKFLKLEVGDWVTYDNPLGDLTYRIVGRRLVADSLMAFDLKQIAASAFGDAGEYTAPARDDETVPVLLTTVAGFGAAASFIAGANGQRRPVIDCTWTPPGDPDIRRVKLRWRVTGTSGWSHQNEEDVEGGAARIVQGILESTSYDVQASISTKADRDTTWTASVVVVTTADWQMPDGAVTATQIVDGSIITAKIADAAVTAGKVADAAIGTAKLADLAVTTAKVDAAAITTAKIAAAAVDAGKIAALAVGTTHLDALAVTAAKVAANAIETAKLAAGAVTTAKIAAAAVTANELAAGAVTTAKFASGLTPVEIVGALPSTGNFEGRTVYLTTDDKLYRYSGTAWTAAVAATDLTGQITGAQLVDGAVTEAKVAAAAITTAKIAAAAVDGGKIAALAVGTSHLDALAVTTAKIAASAVTANELAAAAVTAGKIATGAVGTSHIDALAVTAAKIADAAVETAKIATAAVVAGSLAAGAVTTAKIAAAAVTASEIAGLAVTTAKIAASAVTANELAAAAVTAGKIAANAVGTSHIDALAVTAAKVAASAIETAKLADLAVSSVKIAAGAVVAGKIAANAVTATEIAAGAITTAKLAAGAVTATEIAAGAVTAGKIAANAVTATEIAAGAITTAKLAAGAVTANEIAAATITGDRIAVNTIAVRSLLVSNFANLIQNAGFETGSLDPHAATNSQGTWSVVSANPAPRSGGYCLKFDPAGMTASAGMGLNGSQAAADGHIGCSDGDDFYFEAWSRRGAGGGATNRVRLQLEWRDAANAQISVTDGNLADPGTSWEKITVQGLAPALTKYVIPRISILHDGGTQTSNFDDLHMSFRVGSELIVDGAVIAAKIAAGAVVAGKIAANAVTATELAAGSVTAGKIAANAVTATEIAAGAITTAKLAAGAVTATELAAGSVVAGKIAANAVTATEIAAGAVVAGKIAANAVTATEIAAGAITTAKLAAGAVTATELAAGAVVAGKIAANAVTATEIAAGAITTAKLAAGAVTATEIAAGAITTVKLAAAAVTANEIATNAVTSDKVLAGAIVTAKLAASAVTANELAANSVVAGKIAAAAVSTAELAAGAVTADRIAAGTITGDRIASNTIAAKQLLVSSFDNLVQNAGFETGALDPHVAGPQGTWSVITGAPRSGAYNLKFDPAGMVSSANLRLNGNFSDPPAHIRCGEGDQFYFEAWFRRGTGVGNNCRVQLLWYDSTSTLISTTQGTLTAPAATYALLSVSGVAPAGTAYLAPRLDVSNNGETALIYFDDLYCRRMATGEILVDGAITATKIAAGAVVAGKIAASAVTATEIAAGAITTAKLAAGAVTATELAAGSVTAGKIAANAVTATEIAAGAITTAKLAAGAVTATEIAANAVTSAKILAGSVGADQLAANSITAKHLVLTDFSNVFPDAQLQEPTTFAGTGITHNANHGDANISSKGRFECSDGSATRTGTGGFWIPVQAGDEFYVSAKMKCLDSTVRINWQEADDDAGTNTVTITSFLTMTNGDWTVISASRVVAAGKKFVRMRLARVSGGTATAYWGDIRIQRKNGASLIVDGAITTAKLAASAVTANEIAANAITSVKIAAGAITAAKITAGTITANEISIGGVTTTSLAVDAVTEATSAYTAASIDANSSSVWRDVQSISMTLAANEKAMIHAACEWNNGWTSGQGSYGLKIRIIRGSTDISGEILLGQNATVVIQHGAFGWTLTDAPGAGTHTYKMQVLRLDDTGPSGGSTVEHRTLVGLKAKR